MVKYQFEISDEKWEKWKNTVPRSKSLEARIIELIEADTEDRVLEEMDNAPPSSELEQTEQREDAPPEPSVTHDDGKSVREEAERVLRGLDLPGRGDDLEGRIEALLEMHDFLREREGERVEAGQLREISGRHAHGYADAGSFWSNCVKKNDAQERPNALKALPGVREAGSGEYTYDRNNA
ncbi:hypothetical protein [Natrinema sp. 1APR25-10V2]|uniref:hypothetical protein n=1 Tax=Natrinema sp. 1APR25-10V2 TaxID=2951081 RepID=UPI0028750EDB|nr:hypothetical protein [Natrinema sp. 1APR25-10V2]MDS0478674.1 hypothetical protein [Natrinema sp. 1APR25-10V2]